MSRPEVEATVQPYRIDVPQTALDDLDRRLAATRWPDGPGATGWDRGVPGAHLAELVRYWRDRYDWRAAEAQLNAFPQFTTRIDGAHVHFAHVRSPEPNALPVLLTHGWPGSFAEFRDVVGPLTDPRAHGADPATAFDVVIPSLPGFGFSGPTPDTGWTAQRIAAAWVELMRELGYDEYVTQGGDFGAEISIVTGLLDPERVRGVHVNLLLTQPSGPEDLLGLDAAGQRRLARLDRFRRDLSGYMAVQSTRPHTLAYGLTDSPVGQLAWVLDAFREWSDCGGGVPDDAVDRDLLLTNVMIYWLTGTAGSSAQLYYEMAATLPTVATAPPPEGTVDLPLGVTVYPHDPFQPVRELAERTFTNIVQWREHERGGHFAAMEEPDLFVADLRDFARTVRATARA